MRGKPNEGGARGPRPHPRPNPFLLDLRSYRDCGPTRQSVLENVHSGSRLHVRMGQYLPRRRYLRIPSHSPPPSRLSTFTLTSTLTLTSIFRLALAFTLTLTSCLYTHSHSQSPPCSSHPPWTAGQVSLRKWHYVEKGNRFGTDSLLLYLDHHTIAKKNTHISTWFQSFQTLTFCACDRGAVCVCVCVCVWFMSLCVWVHACMSRGFWLHGA